MYSSIIRYNIRLQHQIRHLAEVHQHLFHLDVVGTEQQMLLQSLKAFNKSL